MQILKVSDLKVFFQTDEGLVKAVNKVNLTLDDKDKLALLGESGAGKTILANSILRLLHGDVKIQGSIKYKGRDMTLINSKELREMRINEFGVIMQNPSSSLNPSLNIGSQISEVFRIKENISPKEAIRKTIDLLNKVKIPEPEKRIKDYPHQFSGGMKERVIIAMGIVGNPNFLIADEPTKGLDAIVKHSIIKLLQEVSNNKTIIMITHDLDVAEKVCNKIGMMYLGELVELGWAKDVFEKQYHPYTKAFFESMPSKGMKPIKGYSESLIDIPKGCRFYNRCDYCMDICKKQHPPMIDMENGRKVRCFLYARN